MNEILSNPVRFFIVIPQMKKNTTKEKNMFYKKRELKFQFVRIIYQHIIGFLIKKACSRLNFLSTQFSCLARLTTYLYLHISQCVWRINKSLKAQTRLQFTKWHQKCNRIITYSYWKYFACNTCGLLGFLHLFKVKD